MNNNVNLNSSNESLNCPVDNVSLKSKVYEWIEYLCTNHKLPVKTIPVMFTANQVSLKFNVSNRHAIRILDELIEEKKIYKNKLYNKLTIYSLTPISLDRDILVRIRP
jgi:hypothetical protein